MNTMRFLFCLLLAGLAFSCKSVSEALPAPPPEEFQMPEFVSVNARTWGIRAVTLTAELTSSRVDECGFILHDEINNTTRITASIEDNIFSVAPKTYWLKFNSTYTVKAFFRVGYQEFLSEEFSFSIGDKLVIVEADDEAFYDYLVENFDTNGDRDVEYDEARAIRNITLGSRGVKSITGFENMENLTHLDCSGNLITKLDLRYWFQPVSLDCSPMEDEAHNNLLEVIRLTEDNCSNICEAAGMYSKERNTDLIPAETIVLVGYDVYLNDDKKLGMLVEAGGAKGILFQVSYNGKDGLIVSVDEIEGQDWNTSLNWCKSYGDGSWDMPDMKQLNYLHRAFYPVTKALKAGGFTPLYNQNGFYWSSTVDSPDDSCRQCQRLWDGVTYDPASPDGHISSLSNRTRAVKMINLK